MPNSIRGLITGLFFLLVSYSSVSAQSTIDGFVDYQWYFGNSTYSIGFNKGFPNDPYLDSIMSTPFGQAGNGTANDQVTGALLFYTDGSTVYDASHQPMPGASAMPAVSANQGIAISPVPGSLDRYYIFAINAAGNLDYSIVNMGLPGNSVGAGNLGSVTTWRQPIPGGLGANVSQAMIVVPKATLANGYWLITQQPNSAIFKVIDISGGGFVGETTTDFQGPGIVPLTASNFSIHNTGMLSVTPTESNKNVQFYALDFASGAISFDQDVQNSNTFDAASTEALYDSEFNPAGDIIFVSQHGSTTDPSGLFAYEYANASQSRRQLFPGTIFRSYGLKYGEDQKIYHLYQESSTGPFLVGRIENPNAPIDSLIYTERIFGGRNFGGKGFPAILPPKVITPTVPTIMNLGSCTTDTVWFFADMDPFTDQFLWNFQDTNFGADSSAVSPGYNFQNPGTYDITVTTRISGNPVLSTPLTLNILQTQLQMDLGQDTVICPGDTLEIRIDDQTYPQLQNVIWSNGETNVQSIFVSEGGTYWTSGQDISTGCVLHDAIQVDEYGINTQISNIWYFGQNAGLDFNQQPPVPLDDGLMVAPEGCAAISDVNGDILFYTDGRTVYSVVNDVHQQMPNGDNLSGDPGSAQSSIIVQFPSDETLFYIFTTNCTNPLVACTTFQLSYSVVDLKTTPGGDVVIKNKPLFQYSTERITAITFGNSVVLLAHEFGTNTFRAYPISPLGIGAPVLSSAGSVHSQYDQQMGEGYMKFSADGSKVAVAVPSGGSNVVELFDFDLTTGLVSNPLSLDLGNSNGKVYGIEFSPNSNWLYATLSGPTSIIYQWHVDSTTLVGNVTDPDYILNSRAQVPSGSTSDALGALQLGPNSVMYVAIDGQNFLGIVNNPDGQQDGTTNATADLTNGQPLASGTTSGLGLPNFVQNTSSQQPQPELFLPPFACVGETISFEATATSIIDQFSWSIFNSAGALVSTSINPIDTISFNIPDDYIFSVRIYNRCLDPIAILTDTLTVEALPQQTTGPVAVPLCDQPVTLMPYDDGPHPEYTYLWSNGATTQDLTVSAIGTYDLTITTNAGCTLDYSVFVGPPFTVDLGPDQTLCDGQALTLDSQANADDYIWEISIGGVVTPILGFETSRFLPLDQIAPPLTAGAINTITVGVVDPINPACIVRDTIDITVNADPVVVVTSTDDTDCDPTINDGTITISDHPTDDLDYVISGPAIFTGLIVSGTGPVTVGTSPADLAAGVYTVDVRSNVTGCSFVTTIVINEPTIFTIASTTTPDDCDPIAGAGTIGVTLDVNVFPVDYIVTDQSGATVASLTNVPDAGGLTFTIPGLLAGTYNLEVSSPTGDPNACSAFAAGIVVPVTPPTDLQGPLQITECSTSADLSLYFTSLTVNPVFEWSDDGGTIYNPFSTPFTTLGQTSVLIKASSPVTCDSIQTVDVIVTPQPTVTVDTITDCSGFVTLSANVVEDFPGAQYSYQWFQGSQPTSISASQSVNVFSNDFYSVAVSHTINLGCNTTTTPQSVTVPIPFVASLTSTPACTDKEYDVIASSIGQGGILLPPEIMVYKWFINGVEQPGETFNLIRRENTPGLYRVEITDDQGCVQSDEINIIVNDPTQSEILPIYNVCFAEIGVLVVDPVSTFVNYAWYNINDSNNPILLATTPTFSTNIAGSFKADLTNGFQCVTGDAFNVVEDCEALIYGPNAIRPGSSIPENNVFFLNTEYVQDFQIFIYSRWGELVFESADKAFEWNGTLNGTLLQAGSYTYIVKYTKEFGGSGETLVQYGGVTIIR